MLIQLTRKCNEGCLHCFVDAKKTDNCMSWSTILKTVDYIKFTKAKVVIITGGEFTLDEDWYEKVMYFVNKLPQCKIILQSNGWWMLNQEDVDSFEIRMDLNNILGCKNVIGLQISTSKKFYPNYVKTLAKKEEFEKMKKTIFVTNWQGEGFNPLNPNNFDKTNLVCLGRGTNYFVDGELPIGNPGCLSLLMRGRLFDEKINTPEYKHIRKMKLTPFQSFIFMNESEGKTCKPMISIDGDIHIGETQFCTKFDHVDNYFDSENENPITIIEANKKLQQSFDTIKRLQICNLCRTKQNISPIIIENFKF